MSTCFAYKNPIFQPAMRIIASISQAHQAVVTTTFDHLYVSGTIVRLDIPPADGMQQADQFVGPIIVTSPTTFTLPLDSTMFTAFAIPVSPSPHVNTCALVVPIGEESLQLNAAVVNTLNPNR